MFPPIGPQIDLQVDLAAAFIAVVALLISGWLGWRQWKVEWDALRLQRDNDLIDWGHSALDACCRAEMLLRPEYAAICGEHDYERDRFATLASLSGAIDRGRLYFPNIEDHKFGVQRDSAFKGTRHFALDPLGGIYDILERLSHRTPTASERKLVREEAIRYKHEFLAIVQSEVDPRRRTFFLNKDS